MRSNRTVTIYIYIYIYLHTYTHKLECDCGAWPTRWARNPKGVGCSNARTRNSKFAISLRSRYIRFDGMVSTINWSFNWSYIWLMSGSILSPWTWLIRFWLIQSMRQPVEPTKQSESEREREINWQVICGSLVDIKNANRLGKRMSLALLSALCGFNWLPIHDSRF